MSGPFHERFNINVQTEESQRRFINRIENKVRQLMDALDSFSRRQRNQNVLDPIMIEVETVLGEPHLTFVYSSGVFIEVWRARINNDFSRCLHATEGLYQALKHGYGTDQDLSALVISTLEQSEVDLGISWENGIFVKKGAGILDETLVNEPLRWLADPRYQNVLAPFKKGLSHFLEGANSPERLADAVTDMYEAMEALAKMVTERPTKDLSANVELFIAKLGLSEPYKRMLKEYVDYANDFRHATGGTKPRQWPAFKETEAFVYLTGLFIRLATQGIKA